MTKRKDALRKRIRVAAAATHAALLEWDVLKLEDAGPDAIKAASDEFMQLFAIENALLLELARRDDPNRQPTGQMPRRALIDGRYVKTGRTVKVDGVRVPVVEYLR